MTLWASVTIRRAACVAAIAAAIMVLTLPCEAAVLVANEDVVLCHRLMDLQEVELRLKAKDEAGAALYLNGPSPPCILLKGGEIVEQLDGSGEKLQVVTRRGTPRFIGWGDRASFAPGP